MSEPKAKTFTRRQKPETTEAAVVTPESPVVDKAAVSKSAQGIAGVNPGSPDRLRCDGDPRQHRI